MPETLKTYLTEQREAQKHAKLITMEKEKAILQEVMQLFQKEITFLPEALKVGTLELSNGLLTSRNYAKKVWLDYFYIGDNQEPVALLHQIASEADQETVKDFQFKVKSLIHELNTIFFDVDIRYHARVSADKVEISAQFSADDKGTIRTFY